VSENRERREESLREVEAEARRAASDARAFRKENERGVHDEGSPGLPADVAEVDRVRAGDNVELADRQASTAEAQRRAAGILRHNAEILEGNTRGLDHAGQTLRENREELRGIQQDADELGEQVARTHEQADRAPIPRIDRAEDERDRHVG